MKDKTCRTKIPKQECKNKNIKLDGIEENKRE